MGKEFARSEGIRVQVTNEQSQQIRKLYKELSDEYKERLRILSTKQTVSARIREQYLKDYVRDLERDMQYLNNNLENTITSNMLRVAEAVVDDSLKLDKEMGFGGIMTKQFYIPQDVVAIVTSGELYKGKWSLSGAIWSNNQKQLQTIDQIVAKGVAGNKSALEIAKDLERYVSPSSARQSRTVIYNKHEIDANGNRVIKRDAEGKPITGKYYFGKVDYNAQRLARTMVSHAYQESFVESTKDNPFIESYRWLASGGDRMCSICAERDGQIYSKDDLPMDHPNGMCTFEAVIDLSYEEIGRKLADWVNGEGDPELNAQIDNYADSLGLNVKQMTAGTEPVRKAEEEKVKSTEAEKPVDHISFETVADAEEYIRNNFISGGFNLTGKDVNLSGVDEETANKIVDRLNEIYSKFGIDQLSSLETFGKGNKKLYSQHEEAPMFTTNFGNIGLNKEILKNAGTLNKYVSSGEESFKFVMQNLDKLSGKQLEIAESYKIAGRSLVDSTIEGMLTHEVGHHISYMQSVNKELSELQRSDWESYAKGISGYANHSFGEYVAESFTAYYNGETDKLQPELVEIFEGLRK